MHTLLFFVFHIEKFFGLKEVIFFLQAIKVRFSSVLDSKNALLAVATLPRFKLRWIKDEEGRNYVKSLLTSECQAQHSEGHIANPVEQKPSNSNYNVFFCV